jgi:predicted nucleic acid-binding protein
VTLSWLLRDASSRDASYAFEVLDALRAAGASAEVPVTWGLEIANVIARAEAKAQITAAQSEAFLEMLNAAAIQADAATLTHALSDTLQLARRYRLSSYDASYLELALRSALPLATLDEDLQRAVAQAGVEPLKFT